MGVSRDKGGLLLLKVDFCSYAKTLTSAPTYKKGAAIEQAHFVNAICSVVSTAMTELWWNKVFYENKKNMNKNKNKKNKNN